MNIPEHRKAIDKSDTQIVKLLNERTKHVLAIGEMKRKAGEEIYAPHRERAVLQRICRKNQGPITNASLRAIYREIMSSALSLEKTLTVAYLSPTRPPSNALAQACATRPKRPSPMSSPRSARTARTTGWSRSRTPPRAPSRTPSTCSWTAT